MPSLPRPITTGLAASLLACGLAVIPSAVQAQERVEGAIQKHGFFQQKIAPEEITVEHGSEFKGAHKVAISVFNVAFPSEFHYEAVSKGHSFLGDRATSAKAYMDTSMTGIDHATQQRITDQAYALLVEQLQGAGYEVVDAAGLTQLAPEFGKWDSLPNFSQGRYGTYVAPTGRSLRFLQGDTAKRFTGGFFGEQPAFRMLDRPQPFTRSPYIAHDGKIGIIAVTLVVDYGVYSSSGRSNKVGKGASVGFKEGVAMAAGSFLDSGTMLEYWGPSSGGFPAGAYLQQPIRSDKPFGNVQRLAQPEGKQVGIGVQEISIVADPKKFEAAANEVIGIAIPKLVSVMAAAR